MPSVACQMSRGAASRARESPKPITRANRPSASNPIRLRSRLVGEHAEDGHQLTQASERHPIDQFLMASLAHALSDDPNQPAVCHGPELTGRAVVDVGIFEPGPGGLQIGWLAKLRIDVD